jgi:hypothetical protein
MKGETGEGTVKIQKQKRGPEKEQSKYRNKREGRRRNSQITYMKERTEKETVKLQNRKREL